MASPKLAEVLTILKDESYLWEWLTAGCLILINLLVPGLAIEPFHRFVPVSDPSLSYPYKSSTVSNGVLYVLTFVAPAAIFLASGLLSPRGFDVRQAWMANSPCIEGRSQEARPTEAPDTALQGLPPCLPDCGRVIRNGLRL